MPTEFEFPVSPAQAALLLLDSLHTGSGQYHVPVAFDVRGAFDVDALRRALDALVTRHEPLRTVFRPAGDGFRQIVTDAAEAGRADVRVVRGATPASYAAELAAESARPFDLARGSLLRCVVWVLADDDHRILLNLHHLVCDGWSLRILLDELAAGYRAARDGQPDNTDPPPVQYADYATWRQDRLAQGGYVDSVGYWRELLSGAPPTPALPTDRARPAVQSARGATEQLVLPDDTRNRLADLARARGTTPFVVLLAAFSAFLSRISGQDDLVVGVPVAGRNHPDLQRTVGLLANTVALRADVSGDPSFVELVARVQQALTSSGPHQDAPFSAVVEAVAPRRRPSEDPLVQVVFAYDAAALHLELPPADVVRRPVPLDAAKVDLALTVELWGPDLVASFQYRTDLFAAATVRGWLRAFRVLLDDLIERPEDAVAAGDLLDPGQRARFLAGCRPVVAAAAGRTAPDLVADVAARRPDATALVSGDTRLTYRELVARADAMAGSLRSAGVGPEVVVGVCLPRGADMAVAVLAVLRAGGAFLPLDAEQPPLRLRHMLNAAGARLTIATHRTAHRVGVSGGPVALLNPDTGRLDVPGAVLASRPDGRSAGPGNTAYLLFTSGSTGTPKGVAVEHHALSNLATAVRPRFAVRASDRVLQYVAFGFDVVVSDLFLTWAAGAELHIAGEHERLGEPLYERLRDSRITVASIPPVVAMSLPHTPDALPDLRTLVVGGESCPPELVRRWARPSRALINAYGPSEATVHTTSADVRAGEPVVIGRPVPNARVYVLDRRLSPVPAGVPGELYIGGAGLARGYAGRPALTAERFVADPYGPPGARLYRSGDLGRYDADGVLSCLGRTDAQVKLSGTRIELEEIESVLAGHPGVAMAGAAVRGPAGRERLVALVVGVDGPPPGTVELRAWLTERLPSAMVPDVLVPVGALPFGPTGKLDRARLPDPPTVRPELEQPYVAPASATEQLVAGAWTRVLGVDDVGVHDNFFEVGGDSLRLLAVLTELNGQTGAALTAVELFQHPTIAALAAHLERPAGAGQPPAGLAASRLHGAQRRRRLTARNTTHREAGQ